MQNATHTRAGSFFFKSDSLGLLALHCFDTSWSCIYEQSGKLDEKLTELERLSLLIACFCHDLDHRGTNNSFQSK